MARNLITVISLLATLSLAVSVRAETIDEGSLAPDFSITRLDGSEFKLNDFKGKKAVYLVFWTTWCTYCMKKIPKLQHAATVLDKQIEILAVNTSVKDTFVKAQQFEKDRDIKYPLAFDFGKKVTDLYGVWGTPTEFIIDINGMIIHRDGVPDRLSEHLSNWNMIDHRALEKQMLAKTECDQEKMVC